MSRRRQHVALRVRWLGRVPYREALAVQQALFDHGREQHLLLLEHDHVFTYGQHADLAANLRCDPAAVGADFVAVNRGGDITYHGPGQLVGYPILSIPNAKGSLRHVVSVEALLIDALAELGLPGAGRLRGYPGRVGRRRRDNPRKIAAIGVRLAHGRTMHGFALNVTTDMTYMREHIVACGIDDRPVTSLAEEGIDVPMSRVVDVSPGWRPNAGEAALPSGRTWRGTTAPTISCRSRAVPGRARPSRIAPGRTPGWSRRASPTGCRSKRASPSGCGPKVHLGPEVLAAQAQHPRARTGHGVRGRRLSQPVGVLVRRHGDTDAARRPLHPRLRLLPRRHAQAAAARATTNRARVAEAVRRMGLDHAVLTMVARDDLPDGGMAHVARCVEAIRGAGPSTAVETLISDAKGSSPTSLGRCSTSGPTCSTTTWRPSPDCSGRCARRPATPAASRCWRTPRRRGSSRSRGSWSASARPTTRSSVRSPTSPASAATSSRSVSTCARRRTTCRSRGGLSRREFERWKRDRRGARHRPRRGQPADPFELPRQGRRRRSDARVRGGDQRR